MFGIQWQGGMSQEILEREKDLKGEDDTSFSVQSWNKNHIKIWTSKV